MEVWLSLPVHCYGLEMENMNYWYHSAYMKNNTGICRHNNELLFECSTLKIRNFMSAVNDWRLPSKSLCSFSLSSWNHYNSGRKNLIQRNHCMSCPLILWSPFLSHFLFFVSQSREKYELLMVYQAEQKKWSKITLNSKEMFKEFLTIYECIQISV